MHDHDHEFTERPNRNGHGGFYLHIDSGDAELMRAVYAVAKARAAAGGKGGDHLANSIETYARNHGIDLNANG